ncbi:MAG: BlaI/MecI/CopY family transcriptional regulator [Rhodothermales bacterium]
MARKTSTTLTDAELRLMDIVWDLGPATVQHVVDALPADEPLAYSTVLTMMRILERKGYLAHSKEGRAFIYRPLIGRDEARKGALKHIIQRFFDDSPELLVLNLMENDAIDAKDLDRLKALLDAASEDE